MSGAIAYFPKADLARRMTSTAARAAAEHSRLALSFLNGVTAMAARWDTTAELEETAAQLERIGDGHANERDDWEQMFTAFQQHHCTLRGLRTMIPTDGGIDAFNREVMDRLNAASTAMLRARTCQRILADPEHRPSAAAFASLEAEEIGEGSCYRRYADPSRPGLVAAVSVEWEDDVLGTQWRQEGDENDASDEPPAGA